MNRRAFLGLVGGAIVAPFVPTPFIGIDLAAGPDYTVVWEARPILPRDLELIELMSFNKAQIARLFALSPDDF